MAVAVPRAHARLGGSAASIFLTCTAAPSVWPKQGKGGRTSSYAAEGTAAHMASEAWLLNGAPPPVGKTFDVDGHQITFDDAMAVHVEEYVTACALIAAEADWHDIEQGVNLDALWLDVGERPPEPLFGTADFVAVTLARATLHVHDLKFGKGVPVSAKGNVQLRYYALGVFLWLRENRPELADAVRHVEMAIHQPRAGGSTTDTIDLLDLLEWGEYELKAKVDAIHDGNVSFVPGDHCRFCPASGSCKALHARAVTVAQTVFPEELDEDEDLPELPAPGLLTDDQLGSVLAKAEMLSVFVNAVRREAQSRISKGHDVPGWKLVAKKGNRQFHDMKGLAAIIQAHGLPASSIYSAPVLMSPAQVETMLKRHKIKASVIGPVVHTPQTGLTLVPASDPRLAVDISPDTVFPDEDAFDE